MPGIQTVFEGILVMRLSAGFLWHMFFRASGASRPIRHDKAIWSIKTETWQAGFGLAMPGDILEQMCYNVKGEFSSNALVLFSYQHAAAFLELSPAPPRTARQGRCPQITGMISRQNQDDIPIEPGYPPGSM